MDLSAALAHTSNAGSGSVTLTVSVTVVTAILTAVLALITWRYAKSTEIIAKETAKAARSTRTAAQVGLLQSLLTVQPLIEIGKVNFDFLRDAERSTGLGSQVPFGLTWAIANVGAGIAYNVECTAHIGHVRLTGEDDGPIRQLSQGESMSLRHHADERALTTLRVDLGELADTLAKLIVKCRDAYGAVVEVSCEVPLRDGEAMQRKTSRAYDGGEELRTQLRAMVDELLKQPATMPGGA